MIVSAKIRDAAVGQVVAGDARHDDVLEPERRDGLGDAARLVVVEPGRPAGLDRAEAAGPGAGVAEDHDRGGALVPALADVRAVGLLADRVQAQAAEQALEVVVVVAGRDPGPDPVGVPAERQRAVGGRPDRARRRARSSASSSRRRRDRGPPPERAGPSAGGSNIGSSRAIGAAECTPVAGSARDGREVSRRPSSSSRATKPSSRAALACDAQ